MLLTILEIVAFMAAAAVIGVALGWVLRGTLGREQMEISDLRAQIRKLKRANREMQAAAKAELAPVAETSAKVEEMEAPAQQEKETPKEAKPKAAAKVKKPAVKPAATKKKSAVRKSKAERDADQAASAAAFAEAVKRIGASESEDNLTKIYGIGKKYASMLNDLEVSSYKQIASLRKTELRMLAGALGVLDDRLETEDWVGSAKKLVKKKAK